MSTNWSELLKEVQDKSDEEVSIQLVLDWLYFQVYCDFMEYKLFQRHILNTQEAHLSLARNLLSENSVLQQAAHRNEAETQAELAVKQHTLNLNPDSQVKTIHFIEN